MSVNPAHRNHHKRGSRKPSESTFAEELSQVAKIEAKDQEQCGRCEGRRNG